MGATDQGVIGQSIRRKEDQRFLTGAGQFTDDVNPADRVTQAELAPRAASSSRCACTRPRR